MNITNGGDTLEQEERGTTQLPDELDELWQEQAEENLTDDDFDPEEELADDDDDSLEEEC